MTTIQIQRATAEHGSAISELKNKTWSHETTSGEYCARVLAEPDHITHIATLEDKVVGFVDGFMTYAQDGLRRWEVDLLAVDTSARNQGVATQLITANLETALNTWPIDYARTLIQVDNISSQRAFQKCGFIMPDAEHRQLYVAPTDNTTIPGKISEQSFIVPVTTLSYQGLWIEGIITSDTLVAARAILSKHKLNTAGLLIHFADTALIDNAKQAGYEFVAKYNFWYRYFS